MTITPEQITHHEEVVETLKPGEHHGFDSNGVCSCKSNPAVEEVRRAIYAAICPECRDGKHGNCDGTALDEATDDITECRCPPAFHPKKRS